MQRRQFIAAVIEAFGGIVATAYHAKASVPAVYGWKRRGFITQARPALMLSRAAEQQGLQIADVPVTIDMLVGLVDPPPMPPTGTDDTAPAHAAARGALHAVPAAAGAGAGAAASAAAPVMPEPRRTYANIRPRKRGLEIWAAGMGLIDQGAPRRRARACTAPARERAA